MQMIWMFNDQLLPSSQKDDTAVPVNKGKPARATLLC